ncbi:Peptidase [Nocardioides exalbidus]|uniref:Peptidase n=1 Tax=Nocardioides exalbidus TaxID=402596 RepID=A0A1H4RCB9_9ACTN|nr:basic secretory protein-like protein [Nocardioides exalbidus]SEC29517.1 Peptidase [Nocardioides exalbidus]
MSPSEWPGLLTGHLRGRRRRSGIRSWANALVAEHGRAVADVMGLEPVRVLVVVSPRPGIAVTGGRVIRLHEPWFVEHPDDAGCVVHELSHAYLQPREHSERTHWVIEGIADLTRNRLGLSTEWSQPGFEPGAALTGYQPSAHFLAWVDEQAPGTVVAVSHRLREGTYDPSRFAVDGRTVDELVRDYEAAHA